MHALLKAAIVVAHGLAGWALCALMIGIGRQLFSMDTTLILHAIGAPLGFSLLSFHYHRRFNFTRPMATALLFLGIVVALDVFLVAMVFERSFAMFRSAVGTWLPFALIFAATYGAGAAARCRMEPSP